MFKFFLIFLIRSTMSSFCGGDFSEITQGPRSSRHLISRSSVLSPIRLSYYYYNFTLNDTSLETQFKTALIPLVDSFFRTSLSVYSISENLVLTSSTCLSSVIVPEEHRATGIPNTDVIIYITTNSLTSVSYVAFAGACETDQYGLGNVLAGSVVINQKNFKDNPMEDWLANIAHEMSHLLGFSQGLMSYWKNSSGLAYADSDLRKNITIRDTTKTVLTTPTVLEKARKVFNCSSLEGLELEDSGGSGTAGSHWDKRIMMNDYMTAYIPTHGIFSDISLALFKDTGWYEVDYLLAQSPYFGRNAGCDFFNKKCIVDQVSVNTSMWCTSSAKWGCDFFGLSKGGCTLTNYTSLATEFQYFPNNLLLGGNDKYTDYCPFNMPLTNGNCRGSSVATFTFSNSYEVIGQNSRCFESTLMRKPYKISSSTTIYAACYEVTDCNSTTATIKIGNDTVYCPFDGSNITVTGWNGWFKCPSNNMICADVPCKSFCYARGTCSGRGVCSCFSGFGGDFCNVTCNSNCVSCSLSSNCTSCAAGFSLMTDRCCPANCGECTISSFCSVCSEGFELNDFGRCETCKKGYFMDSGKCIRCMSNCLDCTSQTNCISCGTGFYFTEDRCCPSNCSNCNETSYCSSCITNYQLASGRCDSCIMGYYLQPTSCEECSSKCEDCVSFITCNKCSSGYLFLLDRCCPNNCLACDSLSQCSQCFEGYLLSSDKICDSCLPGYYNSSGVCKKCLNQCIYCDSDISCDTCGVGFYSQIDRCCPNNCLLCSTTSFCAKCNEGYSLSTEGLCDTCIAGYYNSSGTCVKCYSNCLSCPSNSICNLCSSGYNIMSDRCCPNNCLSCNTSSFCSQCSIGYALSTAGKCDSCNQGYYALGDLCLPCASNCLICGSETKCFSCSSGFLNFGDRCCPSNCLYCSLSSSCLQCDTRFKLSSDGICDSCSIGHYLSNNDCLPCLTNCEDCTNSTACITCRSGYSLSNGICNNGQCSNCEDCPDSLV